MKYVRMFGSSSDIPRVYHLYPNCRYLERSVSKYSVTDEELATIKSISLCKECARKERTLES